jgi:hypothetical protein
LCLAWAFIFRFYHWTRPTPLSIHPTKTLMLDVWARLRAFNLEQHSRGTLILQDLWRLIQNFDPYHSTGI